MEKPVKLCNFWVSDCQGGGTLEKITEEEYNLREAFEEETGLEYNDYNTPDYDLWLKGEWKQ